MNLVAVWNFILNNKWVILFYLLIVLLIYIYRRKFQFEAKFIAMYRAKWGIPLMERIAKKHSELIKIIGIIGIGVGFVGMLVILFFLVVGVYNALFVPDAAATFSLVIPGVKIPGSPIVVPFWYGIISLFIVVVIHEFCHGVVSSAYNLKVKHTGIVFFGPLIGAFVEPDEKELGKRDDITQMSLFAAGPFSNIILAVVIALFLSFVMTPIQYSMIAPNGISFQSIQPGYPAANASVQAKIPYDYVNGEKITDENRFSEILFCTPPGAAITIANHNESHIIMTIPHASDPKRAYIGVTGVTSEYKLKHDTPIYNFIFKFLLLLNNPFTNDILKSALLQWIYFLSLGIGLANLLPLGPVDGGRMIQLALMRVKGKDKGMFYWKKISIVVLVVLLCLVIYSILKDPVVLNFFTNIFNFFKSFF